MTVLRNMYKILIVLTLAISSCSSPNYKDPHVIIHTDFGKIEVELYPQKAPQSVAAFVSYINKGFYKKQFLLPCAESRGSSYR